MSKNRKDIDAGWAWWVTLGSFMNLLMASGIAFISGIFQKVFLEKFQESVAWTSWTTALFSSLMQLAGPLSGLLSSWRNCRTSVMIGGSMLSLGLAVSSFATSMAYLFISFGLVAGIGLGLMYSPSIVVVNYFFDRRRTVMVGFVLSASGIGMIGTPVISRFLIDTFTWQETLLILACMTAHVCVFGALFFPLHERSHQIPRFCSGRCKKQEDNENDNFSEVEVNIEAEEVHAAESTEIPQDEGCQRTLLHQEITGSGSGHEYHQESAILLEAFNSQAAEEELHNDSQRDESLECLSTNEHEFKEQVNDDKHESILETVNEQTCLYTKPVQNAQNKSLLPKKTFLKNKPLSISPSHAVNIHHSSSKIMTDEGEVTPLKESETDSAEKLEKSLEKQSTIEASAQELNTGDSSSTCKKNGSIKDIFRSLPFLMLCLNLFFSNAACGIFNIHLPAFSQQRGLSDYDITFILAMDGLALFFSRILIGALGHDTNVNQLSVYFGLHLISSCIQMALPFTKNLWQITVVAMLYGIYYGSAYSLVASLAISIVGLHRLSFAFGVQMIFAGSGYLVAPPLAGWIVDATGNYDNSMYLGGGLMFLSTFVLFWVPHRFNGSSHTLIV